MGKNKSSTWPEECMSQQAGTRKGKVVLGEALQCSLWSSLDWRDYIYMYVYLSIMILFFSSCEVVGKQWWEEVITGEAGRLPSQAAESELDVCVWHGFTSPPSSNCLYQEKRYSLAQIQAYSRDGICRGLFWMSSVKTILGIHVICIYALCNPVHLKNFKCFPSANERSFNQPH